MPILSKCLKNATCSEFIHPWCNNCFKTFFIVWKIGFSESVKLYSIFYMISSLVTMKKIGHYFTKFPKDVLRSSIFLSLNGALFSMFICILRYFLKFNILSIAYIPSFLASFISLCFERKSRRQQLTVYMINIAFQTIFLMLQHRGYVSTIKNGEVLMFSFAAAGILYLYVQNRTPKYISKILSFTFGDHEILGEKIVQSDLQLKQVSNDKYSYWRQKMLYILDKYSRIYPEYMKLSFKSDSCMHKCCIQYIIFGFHKPLFIGFLIEAIILILKNFRALGSLPAKIKFRNLKLGLFLSIFSMLFRFLQCFQRNFFNKSKATHALFSGFFAGMANKLYPSVSISMYSLIKLGELYASNMFDKLSDTTYTQLIIVLYSFATSIVFNAAIMEPSNVPKAYIEFLNRLTRNKISSIDRKFLNTM